MKALTAPAYGPVDSLTFVDRPIPEPGRDQIVVRVRAVGLNPLDVKLITGEVQEIFPVTPPFTPGMDVAGVVESVGAEVTDYAPGDEVVGFTVPIFGTLAEYALATVGPCLAHRPPRLDPVKAAALPAAAMTAATMIDLASPQSGQTVLVVGATGGVGTFTVQLAARAGARVLATALPDDADQVRDLGAHAIIDYSRPDTTTQVERTAPDGVHIVIDLVNHDPTGIVPAVADGGGLVSLMGYGARTGELARDITFVRSDMTPTPGRLADLLAQAETGALTVAISAVYPFTEADHALADLAGEHTRGKLAVTF